MVSWSSWAAKCQRSYRIHVVFPFFRMDCCNSSVSTLTLTHACVRARVRKRERWFVYTCGDARSYVLVYSSHGRTTTWGRELPTFYTRSTGKSRQARHLGDPSVSPMNRNGNVFGRLVAIVVVIWWSACHMTDQHFLGMRMYMCVRVSTWPESWINGVKTNDNNEGDDDASIVYAGERNTGNDSQTNAKRSWWDGQTDRQTGEPSVTTHGHLGLHASVVRPEQSWVSNRFAVITQRPA